MPLGLACITIKTCRQKLKQASCTVWVTTSQQQLPAVLIFQQFVLFLSGTLKSFFFVKYSSLPYKLLLLLTASKGAVLGPPQANTCRLHWPRVVANMLLCMSASAQEALSWHRTQAGPVILRRQQINWPHTGQVWSVREFGRAGIRAQGGLPDGQAGMGVDSEASCLARS